MLEKGEALLTNIEKYLEDNPMSFYTSLVKSSANTSSGDANPGEEKNGIVGIAGSVNLMEFNNKSDAVIADGAEINQLYNPNNAGYTRLDKAPAVKVSADAMSKPSTCPANTAARPNRPRRLVSANLVRQQS